MPRRGRIIRRHYGFTPTQRDNLNFLARAARECVATALMSLGAMVFFRGDFTRARTLVEESAARARSVDDSFVVGFSLRMIALGEMELGNLAAGVRRATEGQEAARDCPNP